MSANEGLSSKRIEGDPSLLQQVLVPYKPHCRYLLRAHLEHGGQAPAEGSSRRLQLAAQGEFSIPESCYIADTGHFNAVEFNICYNQLAYFLLASCVQHRLEPLAQWSLEEYRRRQLGDFLIVQFSSSFRKQMRSDRFTGRVEIHKVMNRGGSLFLRTYCRFEDGHGGMAEGEPLIAIIASASPRRLHSELRAAAPRRRPQLLMTFLQEQLGPKLGMEPAEIGPRDNLMDLGVDSLKAVELKGLIEAELGLELSSSLAFDQPNLEALTGFLLKAAKMEASEASEALSEEQLAEQLSAELQGLKSLSGKSRT